MTWEIERNRKLEITHETLFERICEKESKIREQWVRLIQYDPNEISPENRVDKISKRKKEETLVLFVRMNSRGLYPCVLYVELPVTIEARRTTFLKLYSSSPLAAQGNLFDWMRSKSFFLTSYNVIYQSFACDQLNQAIVLFNKRNATLFVRFSISRYSLSLLFLSLVSRNVLFQSSFLTKARVTKIARHIFLTKISPWNRAVNAIAFFD